LSLLESTKITVETNRTGRREKKREKLKAKKIKTPLNFNSVIVSRVREAELENGE